MPKIRFLAAAALVAGGTLLAQTSYKADIEKWRKEREANLRKDNGWLSVAGLFWLKNGENRVGTASLNEIALPPLSAPARVGSFLLRNGKAVFTAESGVEVRAAGKPVRTLEMKPDVPGPADTITIGALSMFVIERGGRYAIRLRDNNNSIRREFSGLHWFDVDEAWRIRAKWVPYNPPKQIGVLDIAGITEQAVCPGYASFTLAGKEFRLEPTTEEDQLFFVFRDLTAGKETYPSGRFLDASAPRDGYVILDFNKAYNPPCAFTPFATCPLPSAQNRLPVRIPAGELVYHSPSHTK
jgi:uncharacterized protein (DUF1684 family)